MYESVFSYGSRHSPRAKSVKIYSFDSEFLHFGEQGGTTGQ